MSQRQSLIESIAHTISDYREGEIPRLNAEHVDRWIHQFDDDVQLPLLRELEYVFKKTYFSRAFVRQFFESQITNPAYAGNQPCDYWRKAHFLNIQQRGRSQAEILLLFGEALRAHCGINIQQCGAEDGDFIYLDDVLFTGKRAATDLSAWIGVAPSKATVRILVIAMHTLGEWECSNQLRRAATQARKDINFEFSAALTFENRKSYRDVSEVLWPAYIPEDEEIRRFAVSNQTYPFVARTPGGKLKYPIFSSEEGRQLLERQFLWAGMRILSVCRSPSPILRPLGFSRYGFGFGSMIVTYRNCPNNAPLALWWGDPSRGPWHPLAQWYPLFPRKTYASEEIFDGIL
jgi:hypothetical protein